MSDLEAMLDDLQALRKKRDAVVDVLDDLIEMKRHALETAMKDAGENKIKTDSASAYFAKISTVEVADWNEVMKFVNDNKATDILQKRISVAALEARVKAGAKIPGVVIKKNSSLTIRAAKEKGEGDA